MKNVRIIYCLDGYDSVEIPRMVPSMPSRSREPDSATSKVMMVLKPSSTRVCGASRSRFRSRS